MRLWPFSNSRHRNILESGEACCRRIPARHDAQLVARQPAIGGCSEEAARTLPALPGYPVGGERFRFETRAEHMAWQAG